MSYIGDVPSVLIKGMNVIQQIDAVVADLKDLERRLGGNDRTDQSFGDAYKLLRKLRKMAKDQERSL